MRILKIIAAMLVFAVSAGQVRVVPEITALKFDAVSALVASAPEETESSDANDTSELAYTAGGAPEKIPDDVKKKPEPPPESENSSLPGPQTEIKPRPAETREIRAVWISYLEFAEILKGKTKAEFLNNICAYFDNCVDYGLNTVIVQVRSHADALYKSRYFPVSEYFTVKRSNFLPFDPLEIMVEEAHRRSLRLEAWINPYRGNRVPSVFAENDIIEVLLETDNVFEFNGYYYLNPGEPQSRQLIVDGVIEIVENYDVDGIHFDDYFYPSQSPEIDSATFNKYGAGKSLAEFRTESVNSLVSTVYKEIKKRKGIVFGISPAGNIDNCLRAGADVKLWGSSAGYVDYLAPQLYWDYGQGILPYEKALSEWRQTVTAPEVKLLAGLAAYRAGAETSAPYWASGDVLAHQVTDARRIPNYNGFMLFRYDHFFDDIRAEERKNLKNILD